MRIGLLLPIVYASPTFYKERIFAPRDLLGDLSAGLVKKGHQVTVFSAVDFPTNAALVGTSIEQLLQPPKYYKFRNLPQNEWDFINFEFAKRTFELETIRAAFKAAIARKIDILHCYHDASLFYTHYIEDLIPIPIVYTLHDPLPPPGYFEYDAFQKFTTHKYISISTAQRKSDLALNFIETVYHGINLEQFPFQPEAADYLLFMGRLVPEKGLDDAIAACLQLNMRLEIGTQFPDKAHENGYFNEKIKPFLADPLIGEPGMVDGVDKTLLYSKAKALLFPIKWEEPFGMVMIEAMACGTPVIAYNHGSVPEIVKDGVTGFIVNEGGKGQGDSLKIKKTGVAGLAEAIGRIGEIDRVACRKHIEEHFSVEKMVENHEKVYEKILTADAKRIVYTAKAP